MRILYDGKIYREPPGGINRYFVNLIGRLPNTFTPLLTTCAGRNVQYPKHDRLRIFRFTKFHPDRLSLRMEKSYFGRVADSNDIDLAHPTYYSLLSQREIKDYRCPVVITVWDMIHELFPQMDPESRLTKIKRRAVDAADAVICISENTKSDLLRFCPEAEEKVTVTHLATEFDVSQTQGIERTPLRPYFLYVGARGGYKNSDGLISAFAKSSAADRETSLCFVGQPFSRMERRKLAELRLTNRVEHYGQVSDHHLAKLYHRCIAFIYPSLYEGFGLPLLEAMSCGGAVIAAKSSSIPEVAGDAALLFNPSHPDDLADLLSELPRNPTLRNSLIEKGYARTRHFSWDHTVKQTLEIYQRVMK